MSGIILAFLNLIAKMMIQVILEILQFNVYYDNCDDYLMIHKHISTK